MTKRGLESDGSDVESASPAPKRSRSNGKGKSPASSPPVISEAELTRAYIDGAIVRIALKNFVTFNDVEFRPGARLNVVLGPNGAGKSTIVCAICLGLNGNPRLLGRAEALEDYIQNGKNKATIELELKSTPNNVVFTRTLQRNASGGCASSWKLNGRKATQSAVEAMVKKMNVQLDNLCQFLPQDRVAEFAKMDAQTLLKETERAVGADTMIEQHNTLIDLGNRRREMAQTNAKSVEQLEELKKQNELMRADVMRFNQRQELLEQVDMMNKKVPWVQFHETKLAVRTIKEQVDAAKADLKVAKQQHKPMLKTRNALSDRAKDLDKLKGELRNASKKAERDHFNASSKLEESVNKGEELGEELLAVAKERKKAVEEKRKAEAKLRETQLVYEENVMRAEAGAEKLREITRKEAEIRARQGEVAAVVSEIRTEEATIRRQIGYQSRRKQQLLSADQQILTRVSARNGDVMKAYNWLQQHKDQFTTEFYGPLAKEISVNPGPHADWVESFIPTRWQSAFVFGSSDESKYFQDEMRKLNVRVMSFSTPAVDRVYNHPLPIEELNQFGVDNYLIDVFDAPEAIKRVLCAQLSMHNQPVCGERVDHIEMVTHTKQRGVNITKSYSIGTANNSKYSRYGNKGLSTATTVVRKASVLGGGVDTSELTVLDSEIDRLERQRADIANQLQAKQREERQIGEELTPFNNERRDIKHLQAMAKASKRAVARAEIELNSFDDQVFDKREEDAKKALAKLQKQRLPLLKKIMEATQTMCHNQRQSDAVCIQLELVRVELDDLLAQFSEIEALIAEKEDVVRSGSAQLAAAKREMNALERKAQQTCELTDAVKEAFMKLPDDLVELRDLIRDTQERADHMYKHQPNLLEDYKRRCEEIERLEGEMANKDQRLGEVEAAIQKELGTWLPALEELIGRINESFSQYFAEIGCSGEVQLLTDEDFAKYGIDILVRFRDADSLTRLTGMRQSGGERSVSTMMYLIALQSLTAAPFRLVDEINQGMDTVNERKIYNRIVASSCAPDLPQMFLITPKLLPDLHYTPAITVLCVFNGPWQDPQEKFDHKKMIPAAKRRRGNNGRSVTA